MTARVARAVALALIAVLAVTVIAACGTGGTAALTPTPEAGLADCQSSVVHANLNVQDVTALDLAIQGCASLAQLERVLAANPGYLDLDMTTPREFATNRCLDREAATLRGVPICEELGAKP